MTCGSEPFLEAAGCPVKVLRGSSCPHAENIEKTHGVPHILGSAPGPSVSRVPVRRAPYLLSVSTWVSPSPRLRVRVLLFWSRRMDTATDGS